MRPKGTAAELERRRREAVGLWKQGMTQAAVAEALGTSEASVSRWKKAWQADGPQALAAKPHPGKPPRLTPPQRRRLGQLLREGPRKHGYGTELWTLARVAELIRRRFGVRYHPGHVWYLLRGMGWSCQKPQRRARERDEAAIRRWRQQDWSRIKKRPKDRPQPRLRG
jgi:transposase